MRVKHNIQENKQIKQNINNCKKREYYLTSSPECSTEYSVIFSHLFFYIINRWHQ